MLWKQFRWKMIRSYDGREKFMPRWISKKNINDKIKVRKVMRSLAKHLTLTLMRSRLVKRPEKIFYTLSPFVSFPHPCSWGIPARNLPLTSWTRVYEVPVMSCEGNGMFSFTNRWKWIWSVRWRKKKKRERSGMSNEKSLFEHIRSRQHNEISFTHLLSKATVFQTVFCALAIQSHWCSRFWADDLYT